MKRLTLVTLLFSSLGWGQANDYALEKKQWVDSVYNTLSLEERVGQLFMVAAYSNRNDSHLNDLASLVENQHIGGLIFFQGGPVRQAEMNNKLQSLSRLPMLVGIDGEWGLSMRLDSTYKFPYNMTLGAIQDMKLIEQTGVAMAKQAKRMGMQFNFGPVVDINTNAKNPIIGVRSYGETAEIVSKRAVAFTRGYESQNVFATAKHFPGHGDTSVDSHYKLPVVAFDKQRLEEVELYPYRELIKEGLGSVMVAHLNLPALEPDANIPSSLSYNIVTKLLREEMGYEGLIFTDALNMKAAANYAKPGEVDLAAFKAGNDLLLFSENVPVALRMIVSAYQSGEITEERLAYSVKKILAYKYKSNMTKYQPIELTNLVEDLNASQYDDLNYKLYSAAMTVIKNTEHQLPIKHLDRKKIAYLNLGDDSNGEFLSYLNQYAEVKEINKNNLGDLSFYTTVIVGYHKVDNPWKNHNYSAEEKQLIEQISAEKNTILVSFAKPYALSGLTNTQDINSIVVAYQNNDFAQRAAADVIFGSIGSKGELPVTINSKFKVGKGIKTKAIDRLGFSTPVNEGMDATVLAKIDSIANYAIEQELTPGMQIVVARHGKVVYQKAFGYHTYDKQQIVKNTDLYDLASLTKILGSLPVLIKMYDEGKLSMTSKLGNLVPAFKGSDKEDITFKSLMTHQSGLPAWIPFYKRTLDENAKPDLTIYNYFLTSGFSTQVAENLFIRKDYNREILQEIIDSKLSSNPKYKYSDLGFIALKEFIERKYELPLDEVVQAEYFAKIGAKRLTYLPLRKFDLSEIPPTEKDTYYRYTTVQGYVHDMGAAMQGGVAGHAGLFGTALDVTKMMQMYLNEGEYGGERFFSTETFHDFNDCVYCTKGNRRGIGFDKPQEEGKPGPTCGCASMTSFGHTGFTGTMAWADPEQDLIYVFLSNRTYPDSSVNRLSKENIRENIQTLIYQSIVE
ncbi:glycoside hydrolase family 3 N-terminal domain-containing protein [Myroides pelagicus]|uniref:glycoside hydrolase family 3 N-terminal domain-containing protein n=1 Tax=Myroides pelagicus TaxID=270914 RepID=UPI002DBEC0F2|nr:glycoside hydrolase family 3 N-terminal domain-containing protein [Myroides pelagicus]MEC4114044.1 glycoside hydrolase family 3 N-terminal domain-containing protein [Myroides pelagicus]